jgi:hypothetical protein
MSYTCGIGGKFVTLVFCVLSFWPGSPWGLNRKSFRVSFGYGNYIQITILVQI